MEAFRVVLYAMAILTSLACTVLLLRGYGRHRYSMLMWSAACFAFLTLNNVLLFVDMVTFPTVDLRIWRLAAAAAGILCMLYALLWEAERP